MVISSELVIVAGILGTGVITGLSALQQATNQKLVDTANAMVAIDQSYSYEGIKTPSAWTAGSSFKQNQHQPVVPEPMQGIQIAQ